MLDLRGIAHVLGGRRIGTVSKFLRCRTFSEGSGSTPTFDADALDGFLVNSFNGATQDELRDYVREKLAIAPSAARARGLRRKTASDCLKASRAGKSAAPPTRAFRSSDGPVRTGNRASKACRSCPIGYLNL